MVGNYPNPRWWESDFGRNFTGDQEPPDSMNFEALEDVVGVRIVRLRYCHQRSSDSSTGSTIVSGFSTQSRTIPSECCE